MKCKGNEGKQNQMGMKNFPGLILYWWFNHSRWKFEQNEWTFGGFASSGLKINVKMSETQRLGISEYEKMILGNENIN